MKYLFNDFKDETNYWKKKNLRIKFTGKVETFKSELKAVEKNMKNNLKIK